MSLKPALLAAALFTSTAALAQPSDQSIPDQAFKSVHLMTVAPGQEADLKKALKDFNQFFAAQGCKTCGYHLFKASGDVDGHHNYLMIADWPNRSVYLSIHKSPGFGQVNEHNPVFAEIAETEVYGRYAEVK
jgi:hypothetical protein